MEENISWEILNAYVDGELDVTSQARVARAIANNHDYAQQVALLSQLKSATLDSVESPTMAVPAERPLYVRYRSLAAGLALLLVLGGSVAIGFVKLGPGSGWLDPVIEKHRNWVASTDRSPTLSLAQMRQHSWTSQPGGLYVPDLSAAKLRMAYLSPINQNNPDAGILIGYLGRRGCRISLLVFPSVSHLQEALQQISTSPQTFGWKVGSTGYIILADGMDPQRFDLIAASVREMSRNRAPAPRETRMALTRSQKNSRPCLT